MTHEILVLLKSLWSFCDEFPTSKMSNAQNAYELSINDVTVVGEGVKDFVTTVQRHHQ